MQNAKAANAMLNPRGYQSDAVKAINSHLSHKKTNPCVVLPTGSGKSFVMAFMLKQWIASCPALKAIVLAHRKELVAQNAEEFTSLGNLSCGIYSASLNRRDTMQNITFAAIDSIYKKSHIFAAQDILIVDEADMIPLKGEGKYRQFIAAMKAKNPNLRVVGLTATPYRLDGGNICHSDHILNEVCYSANLSELIKKGYLCDIRTIKGEADIDLNGVKKSAGDFNLKDLAIRVDRSDIVAQAVKHLVSTVRRTNRKSILVFGIDREHCSHLSGELKKYGIDAPCVFGSTPTRQRDKLTKDFKEQRLNWLISIDTLNVGFNAKRVDCVAMMRPTQSKRVWVQTVGRCLRTHPDKQFALVLDYGDNINRHGPIDLDDTDEIKLATCGECSNEFSRAIRVCPSCGWEIPIEQTEIFEAAEERERTLHEAEAAEGELLNAPRWLKVDGVVLRLHRKAGGKPDSVRVEYQCGLTVVKEWVCIDHPGYAGDLAQNWLSKRGFEAGSVANFFEKYSSSDLTRITKKILCRYSGKYLEIVDYELNKESFNLY